MRSKVSRLSLGGALVLLLALSPLTSRLSPLFAQGTAFSVQGRLNINGSPANGSYDVQLSLFDVSSGGTPVKGPITNSAVAVTNGIFNVTPDFGSGTFNGSSRWVEMAVRPNGGGAFSSLGPRQTILPAPYAMYAANAATASSVASGSAVKSLNGLKDNLTLVGTAGVTVTDNGNNTLTIAGTGGGGSGGNSLWSSSGSSVYYSAGNVGIGTSTPQCRLEVSAPAGFETMRLSGVIPNMMFLDTELGNKHSRLKGWHGGLILDTETSLYGSDTDAMAMLTANGNFSLGTRNPASDTKMTIRVRENTFSQFTKYYGLEQTDGLVRLSTYMDNDSGVSFGTRSSNKLNFFVNGDALNGGFGSPIPSVTIDTAGNVGIGTETPSAKLEINTGNWVGIFARSGYEAIHGEGRHPTAAAIAGFNLNTGPGVYGESRGGGYGGYFVGKVRVGCLEIAGGCDLAEPFPVNDNQVEKGSVLVIDDEHPGQLTRSTRAYDTRVAGIVSGANGINPGISLKQEGALDQGQNVALTGRVYVQADATYSPIKPGDLLTTSDTPGHAMKVGDHTKAQGAILGKAMSALDRGTGMVLVLVTLQ